MSRLFAFGLGFSAQALAERLAAQGWQIAGTARDVGKIGQLAARGYEIAQYSGEAGNAALPDALQGTTHLLHSIPPGPDADPVLGITASKLPRSPRWNGSAISRRSASMATRKGAGSTRAHRPSRTARGPKRASKPSKPGSHSARRSAFRCRCSGWPASMVRDGACSTSSRAGTARRVKKDGQVFSRIHVEDIAGGARSLDRAAAGGRGLQCRRRRAGRARRGGGLCRQADRGRRRRRKSPSPRPTSRRWRGASTRAAGVSRMPASSPSSALRCATPPTAKASPPCCRIY